MDTQQERRVIVTDIRMPFTSMVAFMVKWVIASIPAFFILWVIGAVMAVLFGGFMHSFGTGMSRF